MPESAALPARRQGWRHASGAWAPTAWGRIQWNARRQLWKFQGKQVVHFLHIGKTGGTAVADAIEEHAHTPTSVIVKEGHDVGLRHVPRGDKVVFFLRDPLDRFVSAFYSRRRMGLPRYRGPWNAVETECFSRFDTPDALGRALSSSDEDARAAAMRAMRGIYHVKSHFWDWFGDESSFRARLSDILFVGRQERLADDFAQLKALLGLSSAIALPTDDFQAHRNPAGLDRRLSDEAARALREWYRGDYAFIRLCEETAGLKRCASIYDECGIS